MDRVNKIYSELKAKYRKTMAIFLFLNILVFSLTAASILLNIFAIRKNEAGETAKWLFITIAILSAVSGFISSLMSIYTFRKRNKVIRTTIDKIEIEKNHYREKIGEYAKTNPEKLLMDNVGRIINKNG
ncbi:MAG: DUF4231 domain-containing protein [Mycoplasmataceae bacterium]|nr:DUF4231 domain-containing protein [Mycoplasmataceae bacterium]